MKFPEEMKYRMDKQQRMEAIKKSCLVNPMASKANFQLKRLEERMKIEAKQSMMFNTMSHIGIFEQN